MAVVCGSLAVCEQAVNQMSDVLRWGICAGAACGVAYMAWRGKALSVSGAAAAAIVGTLCAGGGGAFGAVALLLFFGSSSGLSRVGKRKKDALAFEKGGQRDAGQVLANGGVAALCAGLLPLVSPEIRPVLWAAFLGSLSEACADTWATEVGTLAARPPRLIINFRPAPKGASGAVSLPGSLALLAGAALIACIGFWQGGAGAFGAALIGGVLGAFLDSLLGATVQAQYECAICGKITERREHHGLPTDLIRGYAFMNNDVVNALGTLAGAILAGVVCVIFGCVSFQ